VTRKGRPVPSDAVLRESVERQYEGRRQRLEAYAAFLEDALAGTVARPGASAHAVRLASQLVIVRQQAQGAAKRRIPRERAAPPTGVLPAAA
jgi:hypothetical protein